MSDDSYNFTTAKVRLEEIVTQVRKKDTSLEKSLDLLEEGVRLANACTELIDHADWNAAAAGTESGLEGTEATEGVTPEAGVGVAAESHAGDPVDAADRGPDALGDESGDEPRPDAGTTPDGGAAPEDGDEA
jgi:exodeoxyribonuclease VII small subunit